MLAHTHMTYTVMLVQKILTYCFLQAMCGNQFVCFALCAVCELTLLTLHSGALQ